MSFSFQIERTACTRRVCVTCGTQTEKHEVQAFIYENGQKIGVVCDDCLAHPNLSQKIMWWADGLRTLRSRLLAMAADLSTPNPGEVPPSLAAVKAKRAESEQEQSDPS